MARFPTQTGKSIHWLPMLYRSPVMKDLILVCLQRWNGISCCCCCCCWCRQPWNISNWYICQHRSCKTLGKDFSLQGQFTMTFCWFCLLFVLGLIVWVLPIEDILYLLCTSEFSQLSMCILTVLSSSVPIFAPVLKLSSLCIVLDRSILHCSLHIQILFTPCFLIFCYCSWLLYQKTPGVVWWKRPWDPGPNYSQTQGLLGMETRSHFKWEKTTLQTTEGWGPTKNSWPKE